MFQLLRGHCVNKEWEQHFDFCWYVGWEAVIVKARTLRQLIPGHLELRRPTFSFDGWPLGLCDSWLWASTTNSALHWPTLRQLMLGCHTRDTSTADLGQLPLVRDGWPFTLTAAPWATPPQVLLVTSVESESSHQTPAYERCFFIMCGDSQFKLIHCLSV